MSNETVTSGINTVGTIGVSNEASAPNPLYVNLNEASAVRVTPSYREVARCEYVSASELALLVKEDIITKSEARRFLGLS